MNRNIVLLLFSLTHLLATAGLEVASPFSDNAVLQQGRPVPVWGRAEAGAKVSVEFGEQKVSVVANAAGSWRVELKPLPAEATPRTLTVRASGESFACENVVVGEVWLASGQSNMQWTLQNCAKHLTEVRDAMNHSESLEIRYLRIGAQAESQPVKTFDRTRYRWCMDSSKTRPAQSAVAFFFAHRLHRELKVPVGIIDTSWGGKPIEGFIPREQFESHEALKPILELADSNRLEELKKIEGGVFIRNDAGHPGRIFNGRLAPLAPYSVRGTIWYQGESNAGIDEDPRGYRHKMAALATGWRQAFEDARMPFYFVQLPPFRSEWIAWARLREEQRRSLVIPHTGMAVTIDLRSADIHPPNKIDVAERLARWSLAKTYKTTQAIPSGPIFKFADFEGKQVRVHFDYVGAGLMVARKEGLKAPVVTPDAPLEHFELRGEDGVWHPAQAAIDDSRVLLTSKSVNRPTAVRYACEGAPANANLYNRAGLPASPFSSDPDSVPWVNVKPN